MPIHHLRDLSGFLIQLDAYGVPRNATIEKAFALDEHINTLHKPPLLPTDLTSLEPDEITDVWRRQVIAADPQMAGAASAVMQAALWQEAKAALRDHVPVILKALRPVFDKAAKAVSKAVATGIQPGSDAQDVLNLGKPDAIAAWQTLGSDTDTLSSIAHLWVDLCQTLDLPPHVTKAAHMIGERPDWTVCFVDPKTNLISGYHLEGNAQWRWLSLAIATGGRLRLNSPEEAERMLDGDGDSPGWIICAAGALVWDDDRRNLQLYRGQWIPSWVSQDQLDNLIDSGLVIAAKPDAVRPDDQHPLGSDGNPLPKRSAFAR
jgi:hypothetical protein